MAVVAEILEDRVGEILTRYNMLSPGAKVGVAVSGGADSVVLVHVLRRLHYDVVLLHVNHQLRGSESDADELFVRALGTELNSPVEIAREPVSAGNVEQQARETRRRFFFEAMSRLNLEQVALAHNRGDQAETVLYRLLRGSGLGGLAGMRPVTPEGFIRPLLTFNRDEIRGWAREQGIRWREDSSNETADYVRNRLRHQTLPALAQQFNPRLECVLAGTAMVAQAEEDWWNLRIEAKYLQITKRIGLGSIFQTGDVTVLHPAEQRRFLRLAIKNAKGDLRSIDLQHIEALRKLIASDSGHDRIQIPGVDALRSFSTVLLARPGTVANLPRHFQMPLKFGQQANLPFALGVINVNRLKTDAHNCANFELEDQSELEFSDLDEDVLLPDNLPGVLHVRNWEPGDQMSRTQGGKPEKLKSLFQEFRILLWERRSWPVVVMGEDIVWSRCFGSSAKFRATDGSRNIVRLTYKPLSGIGSGSALR